VTLNVQLKDAHKRQHVNKDPQLGPRHLLAALPRKGKPKPSTKIDRKQDERFRETD
jgi:hypothetical protein